MTFVQKLFGFHGRMRRRDYWLLSLLLGAMVIGLLYLVGQAFGMAENQIVMWTMNLIFLWPNAAIMVKRLHDRNRSGWLAVIGCLPVATALAVVLIPDRRLVFADQVFSGFVTLWMLVELGILDGTKGPNSYGASPKGIGAPTDAELDEVFA